MWTKSPMQIINEIDNKYDISWDTDANLVTLQQFITENSNTTQEDFTKFVESIAIEERNYSDELELH